jgi:group I intron endonuclease
MTKETYIYKISDELGNVRYIGKSNNPRRRLYQHINDKSNLHKFNWLNSIIKRGSKPIIEVIEKVSIDSWKEREIYWISKFKEDGIDLINMTIGGDGAEGMIHSEESKKKMSNSKKGLKLSEEHRKNISEAVKLKSQETPNYNRSGNNLKQPIDRDLLYQLYITENQSIPEIAEKLDCSEKKVFDNLQDYGIKKDKRIWKKQCASNPTKVVLQYDLSGNLIKEWLSAVSVYKKLKIKPERCCQGRMKTSKGFIWRYKDEWFDLGLDKLDEHSKKVTQYDLKGNFIRDFDSIKEALESLDSKHVNISSCCSGLSKSAGGFIWRYKGDESPKKYSNRTIRGVLQYDLLGNLIDEYDSLVEAAKKTGSNSNGIQMCCVGKYKHSNNFIWKYK